jgi:hypothetical protein
MAATIVFIDRPLPRVLNGEQSDKHQYSLADRWLFEPSTDSPGFTYADYRRGLVLHGELTRFLRAGSYSVGNNLKLMKRLFRLHRQTRTAGMA